MEELKNLNDELKKYVVINEYGLPNIEYPYYQFNIYYPLDLYINEINELFLKQKTYIDLLKEYDKNIKFEVNENYNGEISIRHSEFIEINNIENYSIDEIKDFFNSQKENIDLVKNLDKDLQKSIYTDQNGITSILHLVFELIDVSKYSIDEIKDKFFVQKELLEKLLKEKQYEQYILSLPEKSRVNAFWYLTKKPTKGSIGYNDYSYKFNDFIGNELWEISDKEYWEFSRFLWNNYSHLGCAHWGNEFVKGSNWYLIIDNRHRDNKEYFMTYEERCFFNELPDKFQIYRGFVDRVEQNYKPDTRPNKFGGFGFNEKNGFSFSLSKEVAIKYRKNYEQYNRIDESGYIHESKLYECWINKKRVLGFLNHNQEEEILVPLKRLPYY